MTELDRRARAADSEDSGDAGMLQIADADEEKALKLKQLEDDAAKDAQLRQHGKQQGRTSFAFMI